LKGETVQTVRFGIIGLGLMGREFASAAARWCHLTEMNVRPEIVAVCDENCSTHSWFADNISTVRQATTDYRQLLGNPEVDAVYCAVPHHLHEEFYCAAINSGKHLLGEKPFGIDRRANENILSVIDQHPAIFVRCSSEFPFFPGVQKICGLIEKRAFGQIIEVEAGFLHSSDLDPAKSINWKRMPQYNGEYGVMGDMGIHACHIPFRAGWVPRNVRALLSNIVPERPDVGGGSMVSCDTWDNATLLCETLDSASGSTFPMTIKTQRIAPGEKNTWYLSVLGTRVSARFSTKNPKLLQIMEYSGGEQSWQHIDMGQETAFKNITGGIFEAGFSDSFLQMWAAFLYELKAGKRAGTFSGCVTPLETVLSHKLFTAALASNENRTVVAVQ
jgi:predicted dehydrogenase